MFASLHKYFMTYNHCHAIVSEIPAYHCLLLEFIHFLLTFV